MAKVKIFHDSLKNMNIQHSEGSFVLDELGHAEVDEAMLPKMQEVGFKLLVEKEHDKDKDKDRDKDKKKK